MKNPSAVRRQVEQDIKLGRKIIGDPGDLWRLGVSDIGIPGAPKVIHMFATREAMCAYIRRTEPGPSKCFNLMGLDLKGADLSGADLSHAVCKGANFTGANLDRVKLHNTSMREAIFVRASFRQADIVMADMTGADFTEADFTGARVKENMGRYVTMRRAILRGTRLRLCGMIESDVSYADFTGADISRLFLCDTDATGVNFKDARISQFVDINQSNLNNAYIPVGLRDRFKGRALSNARPSAGMMRCVARKRHRGGAKP